MALHVLFYDYVDDLAERRGPHREGHLAHLRAWHERGVVVMAGALGDPPHTACIVLRTDEPAADAAAIAAEDPYEAAGLIRGWRVEPWNVVVGG